MMLRRALASGGCGGSGERDCVVDFERLKCLTDMLSSFDLLSSARSQHFLTFRRAFTIVDGGVAMDETGSLMLEDRVWLERPEKQGYNIGGDRPLVDNMDNLCFMLTNMEAAGSLRDGISLSC